MLRMVDYSLFKNANGKIVERKAFKQPKGHKSAFDLKKVPSFVQVGLRIWLHGN